MSTSTIMQTKFSGFNPYNETIKSINNSELHADPGNAAFPAAGSDRHSNSSMVKSLEDTADKLNQLYTKVTNALKNPVSDNSNHSHADRPDETERLKNLKKAFDSHIEAHLAVSGLFDPGSLPKMGLKMNMDDTSSTQFGIGKDLFFDAQLLQMYIIQTLTYIQSCKFENQKKTADQARLSQEKSNSINTVISELKADASAKVPQDVIDYMDKKGITITDTDNSVLSIKDYISKHGKDGALTKPYLDAIKNTLDVDITKQNNTMSQYQYDVQQASNILNASMTMVTQLISTSGQLRKAISQNM